MKGVSVKEQAERYIEAPIEDADAVAVINEALNIIGDLALMYESATATIDNAGDWYKLPRYVTNIREVRDGKGNTYTYFRFRGNTISFEHPGKYTIHYRRMPAEVAELDDEIEVHPALLSPLVNYMIAWYKLRFDDESGDGHRHMQMFQEDVLRVYNTLRRTRGPKEFKVIR